MVVVEVVADMLDILGMLGMNKLGLELVVVLTRLVVDGIEYRFSAEEEVPEPCIVVGSPWLAAEPGPDTVADNPWLAVVAVEAAPKWSVARTVESILSWAARVVWVPVVHILSLAAEV